MTCCISRSSFLVLIPLCVLGRAASLHPFVHVVFLELPETAHVVSGHFVPVNSDVHGVIADTEVLAYLAYR